MVSWNELLTPIPSSCDADTSAGDATKSDSWDMLEELDVGLGLLNHGGILLRCNQVFQSAFGQAAPICRSGAAIQQILVLACIDSGSATAANGWVESFLRAFRDGSSIEWQSHDGQWWRAQFFRRANQDRICRILNVSLERRLASIPGSDNPLAKGLAHMGHELRSPLKAILGFADLIRSETVGPIGNPSYKGYANDIFDSGQVLLTAVDRIATLVKLEAGLIRPQSAPAPCHAIGGAAIEQVAAAAAKANVEIRDRVAASAPSLFVDQALLAAALSYLLENAIAASPPGSLVEVCCDGSATDGVVFGIKDRGKGIPAEQLAAIRQPFVRVDNTNPASADGVGMGLPRADRIAALLDCTITLESAPDSGTSARLTVPADRVIA